MKPKKQAHVWSDWYLTKATQKGKVYFEIRRYRKVDGKTMWQRYPKAEFAHLKPDDLPAFLSRLNGERTQERLRAEEAYRFNHTFITPEVQREFDKFVADVTTSPEAANAISTKVHRNFLPFFINKLKLNDPLDWKEQQNVWGKALMNRPEKPSHQLFPDKEVRSKRVIDDNVAAANRFMVWLHERNPRLFPLVKFAPVNAAVLKKHEAKRKLDKPERPGIGRFVTADDWDTISSKMNKRIFGFVWLAYHLGLRRAECLGVQTGDVRKGFFHLQRQLVALPEPQSPEYGPPKNRKDRKVEYWFCRAEQLYRTIESLPALIHPDTLTDLLADEMERLGMDYELHDFRRTWITRALAVHPATAVRLGAGHASIATTMRYVMDDRELDDEAFTPNKTG